MNVKLLRKVVEYAKAEPRRFNMAEFYVDVADVVKGDAGIEEGNAQSSRDIFEDESDVPPCGAVGCIAGLACIIGGVAKPYDTFKLGNVVVTEYERPQGGWLDAAAKLLDLDEGEAERLFSPWPGYMSGADGEGWPEPFASEYKANELDPDKRVEILERRVEHFIQTEGRE